MKTLRATMAAHEDETGRLFWLLHITGLGLPYTVEQTFATSAAAERYARQLADSCRMLLALTTQNLW